MEHYASSCREDRKTIEKNRRNHMKFLYSKLNSLIAQHPTKEAIALLDQLEKAENYIKKLQTNVEKMKQKKEILMGEVNQKLNANGESSALSTIPQIKIYEKGSALEVVLITLKDCQYIFTEIIRILHEEGVDVVNASFSLIDNIAFHTIHSKLGGDPPEYALQAARISERLRKFVSGASSFDHM